MYACVLELGGSWILMRDDVPPAPSTRGNAVFPTKHFTRNECNGVSNHQRLGCLLNRLFGRRSNMTSKLRVTGLCEENSHHKRPVTRNCFPLDDVIISCHWLALTSRPKQNGRQLSDGDFKTIFMIQNNLNKISPNGSELTIKFYWSVSYMLNWL